MLLPAWSPLAEETSAGSAGQQRLGAGQCLLLPDLTLTCSAGSLWSADTAKLHGKFADYFFFYTFFYPSTLTTIAG